MAQTWQSAPSLQTLRGSQELYSEGPDPAIQYVISKAADRLSFEVSMPGNAPLRVPIETVLGGKRHGFSFLGRISEIDGFRLVRAPLIETRYLHYASNDRLELSPGFPKEKPAGYDTALGRVLTPQFEEKCLSCHGPGKRHLFAVAAKTVGKGILNPARVPIQEQMKPCSGCHAGFSKFVDPMPDDLRCWRQSAGRITCVNSHNLHQDAHARS